MAKKRAVEVQTRAENETELVGRSIGRLAAGQLVVLLVGPLGAGKTVLARGIAHGLGYDGYVRSPSYTLLNCYPGRIPMFHFDLYRLDGPSELDELGVHEYFYDDGVSVVEWADRIRECWPEAYLLVELDRPVGPSDRRVLRLSATGELPGRVLRGLTTELARSGIGGEPR